MGKRGPIPKSAALRALQGNPGRRDYDGAEPHLASGIPPPPEHLDRLACLEWGRVAQELYSAGLLSGVDRAALAAYCQAWSRWVRAEQELSGQPLILKTARGYRYPNPLLGIANTALEQVRRLASEFGMTPGSRGRVRASEPQDEDPFAEYIGERESRRNER